MKKTILTLSALAASFGIAQGATIHTGLMNYWTLDNNASDTAGSLAGNTSSGADNGTIEGTAGAASYTGNGLFGSAVDFERTVGIDGRIAVVDSADVVRVGLSVSISAWVQGDDQATSWQGIVAKGESTDYRVAVDGNASRGAAYAGGSSDIRDTTTTLFDTPSAWHHIVATTNATTGLASLYVDGALFGTQGGSAITDNGAGFLYIGGNPNNASDRMFDGIIDDVAMWDREVSLAEVQEIYNAGLAGTSLGAIPEPGVGVLIGLAGLGVVFRRRK